MRPDISIVIPVYNKIELIERCFHSISNQTFTNFEVIVIDDGSTDDSLKICSNYSKIDCRFKIIHQKNAGVSAARQTGLEQCSGKYIIHVDPDDTVEPNYIELLHAKAIETDADMVICDYNNIVNNKVYKCTQNPQTDRAEDIKEKLFLGLHASCWNKLIKAELIKNKVSFPNGINMCEDLVFIYNALGQCKTVGYVNKALYNYYSTANSITHSCSNAIIQQLYNAYILLIELAKNDDSAITPLITASFCGHLLPRIFKQSNDDWFNYKPIVDVLTENIWSLPVISLKTKIAYYLASKRFGSPIRKMF